MDAKMDAVGTARGLVDRLFPECRAAFVGGSVIRGEATATSDLDIVLVTTTEDAPFRESRIEAGWPVELFVQTPASLRYYFNEGVKSRRPAMATLCVDGVILRDVDGLAQRFHDEARQLLEKGPKPLTPEEIEAYRYGITDLLDDLIGSERDAESLFIAHELAVKTAEFFLAYNLRWSGHGKWIDRALRRFDPGRAGRLILALQAFSRTGSKRELIQFADDVLAPAGGRLFEGFRQAGHRDETPDIP